MKNPVIKKKPFNFSDLIYLIPFVCIIFFGCAAVAPPPGGPIDKTPPSVIDVAPISGTTGIEEGFTVQINFSERIDELASQKGVRISPTLNDPLKIGVKKNAMMVTIPGELEEDRTYLITLSRDILDERGNKLDRTYQLAFSTGDSISQGLIEGVVYQREGITTIVYLYQTVDRDLDSLFLQPPDYYTETDDSGYYSFSYLEEGDYQLISFQGGKPPSVVSPSRMPYGVHWFAPNVLEGDRDTLRNVNMKLFREVLPFQVVSVKMETAHRGVVRFTNPVKLSVQDSFVIQLTDSTGGEDFIPEYIFQYRDGESELRFFTDNPVSEENMIITLNSIVDSSGQILEKFSQPVKISAMDTSGPVIISPQPEKNIKLDPGDNPFEIQFSSVVSIVYMDSAFVIQDTSQLPLKKVTRWKNATRIQILPENGWQPERVYTVRLFGDFIRSVEGESMEDSTVTYQIEVNSERGFGGLYGRLKGKFIKNSLLVATSTEKPSLFYFTDVNSAGQFSFRRLPASYWILATFQDRDDNGRYGYGRAVPFQPSEPFFIFPDTIEVRANWDVEGVILEFQ